MDGIVKNIIKTEIDFLPLDISYQSIFSYDHDKNTIFEFNVVRYTNTTKEEKIRKLKGTYLPIVPINHNFHFLKEYLGSFLYYRKHINKNAKIIWINTNIETLDYHNNNKPIQKVLEMLSEQNVPMIFLHIDDFKKNNLEFEKIAIIYDPYPAIVSTQFPPFDQFKHTNNKEVREFFIKFLKKDLFYPKKIYVSRKNVSKYLKNKNLKNHISRYNEEHIENAIEDFFIQKEYSIIDFSGMEMEEQIKYMYNATHVAGIMGAGTWNGIFCDNGVKYFCIKTHMWFQHDYNKDMESVIDLDYKLIEIYKKETYGSVINELNQKILDA